MSFPGRAVLGRSATAWATFGLLHPEGRKHIDEGRIERFTLQINEVGGAGSVRRKERVTGCGFVSAYQDSSQSFLGHAFGDPFGRGLRLRIERLQNPACQAGMG